MTSRRKRGAIPLQGDRKTQALAEQLEGDRRQTRSMPAFLTGDGKLVKDVSIGTSTSKDVHHGLGRLPQGWLAVNVRMTATSTSGTYPEELSDSTGEPLYRTKEIIKLTNSSSAATIYFDLWVY